jgi:hypothetical protein
MLDHLFTSFAVPSIPQLHESLLGVHVRATDLDDGSFHANLVCGIGDKSNDITDVHPFIKFDEPMSSVKVHAINTSTGDVVWDAQYNLGGKQELARDLPASSGTAPDWHKICTPRGEMENYRIEIKGCGNVSGPFNSQVSFTSDNSTTVELPARRPMDPLPSRVGPSPTPAITVPIRPDDFNPLKYIKYQFS